MLDVTEQLSLSLFPSFSNNFNQFDYLFSTLSFIYCYPVHHPCVFLFLYIYVGIYFNLTKNYIYPYMCLPNGSHSIESTCNAGDPGWIPGLGKSPGKKWQPTPVFLPGEFHGPWLATIHGVAKSQTWVSNTHIHKQTHTHTHILSTLCLKYFFLKYLFTSALNFLLSVLN